MRISRSFLTWSKSARSGKGSALVIVLCIVVLLTLVVLAMLSHAMFSGLIANASSNVSKADLYGHGTINQIIGDLRQEIAAGSSPPPFNNTLGVITTLYRPKTVAASVPYNSGPAAYSATSTLFTTNSQPLWISAFPNLVKESANGVAFYPASYDANAPNRASTVNSTTASRNGRYVSTARWNKALLLPKANTVFNTTTTTAGVTIGSDGSTDPTPISSFVAPDWIFTTADGNNACTAATPFNSSLTDAVNSNIMSSSPKYVVGRYAYAIYNEGGLLDVNVAGSPSASNASKNAWTTQLSAILSRKGPSAFADLTKLPGIADLANVVSANTPQTIVDSLVGWRNGASSQAATGLNGFPGFTFTTTTTGNYFNYLLGISNNFMSMGTTSAYTGQGQALTDQVFTSRQQMISFFENTVANNSSSEVPYLQDAMMYLGTFSRTLNQPSYWPDPTRPMVVGLPAGGGGISVGTTGYALDTSSNTYNGGNSAYQLDPTFNPAFRSVRVFYPFTRYDGTTAAVGDPLVKKRFPLSRLCWLTYKGPSALLSTSDPLYTQYVYEYTGSTSATAPAWFTQLWNEGTAANIKACFGLTWTAGSGTGGIGGYWTYNHDLTSGGVTFLGSLSDVANNTNGARGTDGGDPDFFELLKAAINCGSLGVTVNTIGAISVVSGVDYTAIQDSSVTPQVFQIGANIIDEANPTQYPTHIVYTFGQNTDNSLDQRSVFGAMDLPYFSAMTPVAYITANPNPSTPVITTTNNPAQSATQITQPSAAAGTGVILEVPSVWNPYDVNGPSVPAALAPSKLRVALATDIISVDQSLNTANVWPGVPTSTNTKLSYTLYDQYGSTSTTNVTTTTNVTNPICKGQGAYLTTTWTNESGQAIQFSNPSAGSPLYREPTALMVKGENGDANLTYDSSSLMASNVGSATEVSGNTYIGFWVGTFPSRWTAANPAAATPGNQPYLVYATNTVGIQQTPWTARTEYSDGAGNWIPYMEYPTSSEENAAVPVYETGTATTTNNNANNYPYLLTPNVVSNSTGSLWNGNVTGCPGTGGNSAQTCAWDPRTPRWGSPWDVSRLPFLDNQGTSGAPMTFQTVTLMPSTKGYSGSHSYGGYMAYSGVFEPTGGVTFGYKQLNDYSPPASLTTDYYMDPDGTVRRASGAFVSYTESGTANITGSNVTWSLTAASPVGLMLAGTVTSSVQGLASGTSLPAPATYQSQSRPIILHRPYRSVAELGYAFSGVPFRNVDFFTPESGYSALLDTFCINEDYRTDPVMAGRVDLNTRQAPVIQALLAGAYRDEEYSADLNAGTTPPSSAAVALTSSEAITLSQALVTRTAVKGTSSNTTGPQPLFNIADLVGRWISGTTVGHGNGTAIASPIGGSASYDGFSADLAYSTSSSNAGYDSTASGNSPSGNFNVIQRFREATMRGLSDAGQAGTWNLLIDVIAQSGHYPINATVASDFLVEGERRYWVHVAIDRQTGQIVDENIEVVNE